MKGVSSKETVVLRRWGVLHDNLVLSTGLIMWIGHRKEIGKLAFRSLVLRQSESRNCGLCVACIQVDGATLSVGAWKREKQQISCMKSVC